MVDGNIIALFIVLLRTFIPLAILKWPLAGGILALLSDAIDVMLFEGFGYGFLSGIKYHNIDKTFDTWYLLFEFFVVLRWKDKLAKRTGSILFGWRALGFLVFILFGLREAFFFAPNLFEYFFLVMLIIWKFNDKFELKKKTLAIILAAIAIPSFIKEYIMHFKQFSVWTWTRDNIFFWLYK